MKTIHTFSPCLIASVLIFAGCNDGKPLNDDGPIAEGESESGDGDGDPEPNPEEGTDPDEGTNFVPIPADGGPGPTCDPWAQDCPEGEKCVAYSPSGGNWDANHCVAISGEGQPGDPCTYSGTLESIDDCGADSFCWNVNMEGVGVCTSFCEGTVDNPVCSPEEGCTIANEGSINLCLPACDPLLQNCDEGSVCFYDFTGDFVCTFAADMILTGGQCGFINDCAPGNVCLDATVLPECDGAACCGAFCSLSDPTCTTAGTECTPFFEEGSAPPAYVDIGVCIVPGA